MPYKHYPDIVIKNDVAKEQVNRNAQRAKFQQDVDEIQNHLNTIDEQITSLQARKADLQEQLTEAQEICNKCVTPRQV